jgi:hypothetical protein
MVAEPYADLQERPKYFLVWPDCEPASNVHQNFRPPPLFDQYVAAPVRVQSRRLFALYFPYRQTTPQNACSNSAITINYLPAVGVCKIPNLEAPLSYWI